MTTKGPFNNMNMRVASYSVRTCKVATRSPWSGVAGTQASSGPIVPVPDDIWAWSNGKIRVGRAKREFSEINQSQYTQLSHTSQMNYRGIEVGPSWICKLYVKALFLTNIPNTDVERNVHVHELYFLSSSSPSSSFPLFSIQIKKEILQKQVFNQDDLSIAIVVITSFH
jgi:hypothetical protein